MARQRRITLTTCVAYVHMNPVEAGIVGRPEEYQWSSYASYLGLRRPPNFLDTDTVLAHYGNDLDRFRLQTEKPDSPSITEQLRTLNPPTLLGDGSSRSAQPPPTATAERTGTITLNEVVAVCAEVAGVPESAIRNKAQGRRCPARQLASFVAHRYADIALRTIADELDHSSAGSVSVSNARFEKKLHDPELRALLDLALAALGYAD